LAPGLGQCYLLCVNSFDVFSLRTLGYGALVWLIPFVAAFPIVPLKKSQPMVFKTLMGLILTVSTVCIARAYFSATPIADDTQGLILGAVWAAICLVVDVPLFALAFKMKPLDYMKEIGIAYLVVPAITWGFASVL
jgi:hypothetical protein